jgi:aspartyl-tRNA(Asn)/glutamyl-tRNA(Gln) amidotransferase subunit C
LAKIIDYVDKLKAVNVDGVLPLRGLHSDAPVLRDDQAHVSGLSRDILENAPAAEGNYFKVPPVIE